MDSDTGETRRMKTVEVNRIRSITSLPNQLVVLLMEEETSGPSSIKFSAFSGQEFQFSPKDNSWVRNNGTKLFFRDVNRPENMANDSVQIRTFGFDRALTEPEKMGLRSWKMMNL